MKDNRVSIKDFVDEIILRSQASDTELSFLATKIGNLKSVIDVLTPQTQDILINIIETHDLSKLEESDEEIEAQDDNISRVLTSLKVSIAENEIEDFIDEFESLIEAIEIRDQNDLKVEEYIEEEERQEFSQEEANKIYNKLDKIIRNFIVNNPNKLLSLIISGEQHGSEKTYLLNIMLISLAKEYGINNICFEISPETMEEFAKEEKIEKYNPYKKLYYFLVKYATDLELKVYGVDIVPEDDKNKAEFQKSQRNEVMADEIVKINESALVIVGFSHLKGLLHHPNLQQYNKLILNVASLDEKAKFEMKEDAQLVKLERKISEKFLSSDEKNKGFFSELKENEEKKTSIVKDTIYPFTDEIKSQNYHEINVEGKLRANISFLELNAFVSEARAESSRRDSIDPVSKDSKAQIQLENVTESSKFQKIKKVLEKSISDEEMAKSAFGQATNTAKNIKKAQIK